MQLDFRTLAVLSQLKEGKTEALTVKLANAINIRLELNPGTELLYQPDTWDIEMLRDRDRFELEEIGGQSDLLNLFSLEVVKDLTAFVAKDAFAYFLKQDDSEVTKSLPTDQDYSLWLWFLFDGDKIKLIRDYDLRVHTYLRNEQELGTYGG